MVDSLFEAELDVPCRSTIITSLTDRPVAFIGHRDTVIMQLMIPDTTKRYLMELWSETEEVNA